jgi:predicted nuclease of predicted toxin-antitoxin system
MAVSLYFDHNVRGAVARGLRARGVDVLTCHEDGTREMPDDALIRRATLLGRVLYTNDDDLLSEAHALLAAGEAFTGVIYVHQNGMAIGEQVKALELIAKATDLADHRNQRTFLSVLSTR